MCVTSCGLTSEISLYFLAVAVTARILFLVVVLYERAFRIEVREKRTSSTREDSRAFILNLIDVYI